MCKTLSELKEDGLIGLKQLREIRDETTERWEATGLLDGLNGNIKENVVSLFEAQLSYKINEEKTMTTEEIKLLEKWENFGLLNQMPDEKKLKCALLFEEAIKSIESIETLIEKSIPFAHETIIFPLIYRVVKGVDTSTELDFIEINQTLVDNFPRLESLKSETSFGLIDYEGEFTADLANKIIEKYNTK